MIVDILRVVLAAGLITVVFVLWMPLISELLSLVVGRGRAARAESQGDLPRLLFLVPAHNEELLIASCVRSLLGMTYPSNRRRIVVIADNCSDATARIVREQGVEAMERVDPRSPGKPRAIAWTLDQIDLREWDACVIVDADSTVAPAFALGLAKLA